MSTEIRPFVSIIIPTYRDWSRLQTCINALGKQTYALEGFEIIIVNNDAKDKIPESFLKPVNCKIIVESQPGSYAARNAGLAIASGSIIGFTDSDCIPDPDWIESATYVFKDNKDIARIGGNVKMFYQDQEPNTIEVYDTLYSLRQKKYVSDLGAAATANMFTKKSVIDQIGGFNAALMSGGDMEWGKRADESGYRIAFGDAIIVKHPARYSFRDLKTKEKRVSGGHYKLQKRVGTLLSLSFSFLKGFKPPFSDYHYIKSQPGLTAVVKMKVFCLRYRLRILSRYEKLKLAMGVEPERR